MSPDQDADRIISDAIEEICDPSRQAAFARRIAESLSAEECGTLVAKVCDALPEKERQRLNVVRVSTHWHDPASEPVCAIEFVFHGFAEENDERAQSVGEGANEVDEKDIGERRAIKFQAALAFILGVWLTQLIEIPGEVIRDAIKVRLMNLKLDFSVDASPPPKPAPERHPRIETQNSSPVQKQQQQQGPPRVRKPARGPDGQLPDRTIRLPGGVEMVFCHIPAGPFLMGSTEQELEHVFGRGQVPDWTEHETPQRTVTLPEYWIAKYPVTVAQFSAFVRATRHETDAEKRQDDWTWKTPRGKGSDIRGKADHPVTCVTWHDAVAFCQWVPRSSLGECRLPSEAEWEKAARGPKGRIYPWGNEPPDATRCNFSGAHIGDTTPVGHYGRNGESTYGCADMAGNVWEWCLTKWQDRYRGVAEDNAISGDGPRVVRGGSLGVGDLDVRGAFRLRNGPDDGHGDGGFRLLAAPAAPTTGASGL